MKIYPIKDSYEKAITKGLAKQNTQRRCPRLLAGRAINPRLGHRAHGCQGSPVVIDLVFVRFFKLGLGNLKDHACHDVLVFTCLNKNGVHGGATLLDHRLILDLECFDLVPGQFLLRSGKNPSEKGFLNLRELQGSV